MNVTCDNCRATIPADLEERPTDSGGAVQVLPCPECGAEYEIVHITARGVRLRAKMAEIRQSERFDPDRYRLVLNEYRGELTKLAGGKK